MKKRKLFVCLAVILLIGLGLYLARTPILLSIGRYLVINEELEKADLIKVLQGGASTSRVRYGIKIFKEEYAPKLLFTGEEVELMGYNEPVSWPALAKEYSLSKGVPPEAIILGGVTTSTYEEAKNLRKVMKKNGYNSAIVISDPPHMRRVAMTFNRFVKDEESIRLIYRSVPFEESEFKLHNWWTDERSLVAVVTEYLKLGLYTFKYFI